MPWAGWQARCTWCDARLASARRLWTIRSRTQTHDVDHADWNVGHLDRSSRLVLGQTSGHPQPLSKRLGSILLGLTAGAILPIQGAINGLLRHDLHAPLAVGITSFVVAVLAMMPMLLFSTAGMKKRPEPGLQSFHTIPWWSWLGGVAGAYYVMIVFTAIPLIGAATTVGLTIAGQQLVSMFVDRYGLLRLPQRPISTVPMASVFLLLTGVALIRVF